MLFFNSEAELQFKVNAYFDHREDELISGNSANGTQCDKPGLTAPGVPTISGLALFLGFSSKSEFFEYENGGEFACMIRRGRLRIEEAYEKRLQQSSPAGAIFALKNMGWGEQSGKQNDGGTNTLTVEIVDTGIQLAESENEVIL